MQRSLTNHVAEQLNILEVGYDDLAVSLDQCCDCGEQNVWLILRRVFPINSIGETDLPSIEILPQHLGRDVAQETLQIEAHTTDPRLAYRRQARPDLAGILKLGGT
jgi:hypothetical protein